MLVDIISMQKSELITMLKAGADLYGEDSWLFIPRSGSRGKICLVSHVDTIFEPEVKRIMFEDRSQQLWSPDGLGADDRAGVYACLYLYSQFSGHKQQPIMLFTDKEESGGIGAMEASNRYDFSDISFFLEIDRKGYGEMVYYNNEPKAFRNYIGAYGFSDNYGSFSDISILCKETSKLGVNLSAGYMNAHTINEILSLPALSHTINCVSKLIEEHMEEAWLEQLQ